MTTINSQNVQQVVNGSVPQEGPKVVPFNVDFTATATQAIDLQVIAQQGKISVIQTAYVDNSLNPAALLIVVGAPSNQTIAIPPYSQGYIPLLVTSTPKLTVSTNTGVVIPFMLLNFAIAPAVWSIQGSATVVNGALSVIDPILDGAVTNNKMQTQGYKYATSGALTPDYQVDPTAIKLVTASGNTALLSPSAPNGYVASNIVVTVSPDASLAAAGYLTLQINDSNLGAIANARVWLPAASATPTVPTGPVQAINMAGIIRSITPGNSLNINLSAALTSGQVTVQYNGMIVPQI